MKKKPTPSVADMRAHIEEIVARHEIAFDTRRVKRTAQSYSIREADGGSDEVHAPPVCSAITYATALHEIGRILGRYQTSHDPMVREQWAWEWARCNAIVWTPAMERCAIESLAWYAANRQKVMRRALRDNARAPR